MYIGGGKWKGVYIDNPGKSLVSLRPSTSRQRDIIFNIIIHNYIPNWNNIKVLDLFAGTGVFGLECLSRGASHCTFVDCDQRAIKILYRNISKVRADEFTRVERMEAKHFLMKDILDKYDLLFIDPPYYSSHLEDILNLDFFEEKVRNGGIVVVKYSKYTQLNYDGKLSILRTKQIGSTKISYLMLN